MGDTRKKGMVQPLAFESMRIFEMAGIQNERNYNQGTTQLQSLGLLENKQHKVQFSFTRP